MNKKCSILICNDPGVVWGKENQVFCPTHFSQRNNTTLPSKPSAELPTDGSPGTKPSKQQELDMAYTAALAAAGVSEIKKKNLTTSNRSFGFTVEGNPLESTHRDYSVNREGLQYSVSNATAPSQPEKMSNEENLIDPTAERDMASYFTRSGDGNLKLCQIHSVAYGVYCTACTEEKLLAEEREIENFTPPNEALVKAAAAFGMKYDQKKPALAYIPKAALYAEGEAFAYGAKKYAAFNYKNGIAVTRTLSAALRHVVQFLEGADMDGESGVHHLGCARANLAMALDTLENHPELDDRFKGGKK